MSFRFRTADEAGPKAAVQAHYQSVRRTLGYRGDMLILVEAPDGTMAGAPGHPQARGLYSGVGFRELMREAPLIKTWTVPAVWGRGCRRQATPAPGTRQQASAPAPGAKTGRPLSAPRGMIRDGAEAETR